MRKFNVKKVSEAGSLMVEAIAMLGLISMVTPVVYKKSAERMNELEDINVASQMRTLSAAVDAYLADNYATLSEGCGDDAKACEIENSKLEQYLPKGMLDDGKIYGVLGDDYKVSYIVNKPENGQPTLTGYVAANNVNDIVDPKRASRIATMIGGNGGFSEGNRIYGAQGVWEVDDEDIGIAEGSLNENSIVAASSSAVGAGGQIRTEDFLHRTEQSRSELNTMYTDLYMYDGNGDAHDIMGVGRLLIGAQDGGEENLNTSNIPDAKYSLYVGGDDAGAAYIESDLAAAAETFNVSQDSLSYNPYSEDGTGGSFEINKDKLKYNKSGSEISVGKLSDSFTGLKYSGDDTEFAVNSTDGSISMNTVTNDIIYVKDKEGISLSTEEGNLSFKTESSGVAGKGNVNFDVASTMTTNVVGDMNTVVGGVINTQANGGINLLSDGGAINLKSIDNNIELTTENGSIVNNIYSDGNKGFNVNVYDGNVIKSSFEAKVSGGSEGYIRTYTKNDSNRVTTESIMTTDSDEGEIHFAVYDGEQSNATKDIRSKIDVMTDNITLSKYDGNKDSLGQRLGSQIDVGQIANRNGDEDDGVSIASYNNGYKQAGVLVSGQDIEAITGQGTVIIANNISGNVTPGNSGVGAGNGGLYIDDHGGIQLKSVELLNIDSGEVSTVDGKKRRDKSVSVQDGTLVIKDELSNGENNATVWSYAENKAVTPSVYIRQGAIDLRTDPAERKKAANAGTGYVSADRFVVDNTSDNSLSRNPSDALLTRGTGGFYTSGNQTGTEKYDRYMVDPAYTSVMHDIKLTSRGGARLSDILPDFINKGIYVVDNSYDEGVDSACFNIYGDEISSSCNTAKSDYASAFLGSIPAPQCPPGYAKVITLQPSGWTMGQVGTLVFDSDSSRVKDKGRAYIQPIDNYDALTSGLTGSATECTKWDNDGNCIKTQSGKTGAVQNYGSVITDSYRLSSYGNAASFEGLKQLANAVDRLIQSSTYMKSAIKVKTDTSGVASGPSSKLAASGNVVGWDTYIGFIYPTSYWSKASLNDLGFRNVLEDSGTDKSFNAGVYWNLFPVDKYSIEGYATVYCYFDRNGILGTQNFNSSFVDTTYNQFSESTHRDVTSGSSKGNTDYVKRLFNPKLKYNDEW